MDVGERSRDEHPGQPARAWAGVTVCRPAKPVPASRSRWDECRGPIESSGRDGLRRTFDPSVLDRITLIGWARAAGFTPARIARFLVAPPGDDEA
ncbi:hypothetical protein [Cryptosporangium japonicum]|uniref:MerR family transcriptional regulator n=1 Tax=Cryptosporangium japonicum TaxID=80872 RepID=A0ABN0V4C2_9ACTN